MADDGLLCWNCGKPTGIVDKVMRSDSCENCLADLRCCRGCRHYDPFAPKQCREHIDRPVHPKDKSNFCDFFQMRQAVKGPGGIRGGGDSKDERKKRFDDLFDD
ncbi:hypothetical protein GF356_09005 [candidate division GN15 bacterium]|nr:hypothetical protein [candidate division GN15 bacterium]